MKIIKIEDDKYIKIIGDRAEVIEIAREIEHTEYQLNACKLNLIETQKRLVKTEGLEDDVLKVVEAHNQSLNIPLIEQDIERFESELEMLKAI
jgi:hypothetical protein